MCANSSQYLTASGALDGSWKALSNRMAERQQNDNRTTTERQQETGRDRDRG